MSESGKNDLLIEIGTEELPPKSLSKMMRSFGVSFEQALIDASLSFDTIVTYATPRRLALKVTSLADSQATQIINKRGPSISVAYDNDGNPSKAALGFMRSCGVSEMSQLEKLETDKGVWLAFREQKPGALLAELISELISKGLSQLPIDRKMRWGASKIEFVRPVHWLVVLYGEEVLQASAMGIDAANRSFGHRFMSPDPIVLTHTGEYEDSLQRAHVIVDFEKRKQVIATQLKKIARVENANVVIDDALLDEVTALVEWPVALAGNFDATFLDIPEEALISAMKSHQRYFHLVDDHDRLLPKFITVANIESKNPETVIGGNERVIKPRLSDAGFFFTQDKKSTLDDKLSMLRNVVFQSKLGSYHDKVQRVSSLAGIIAGQLGANVDDAKRAGLLCKSDLVSDMVNEFPELQGIMGGYYAQHDGESADVCAAIADHYKPTASGGSLPESLISQSVAIADKLDTLTGLFGIGQPPTGSRDPFALRRQTLGVIRMCVESGLSLDVTELLARSAGLHNGNFESKAVVDYLLERLATWYQENGVSFDTYNAVRRSSNPIRNLADANLRIRTLEAFRTHPRAQNLIAANKRIANILKKVDIDSLDAVSSDLFEENVEQALFDKLEKSRLLLNDDASYEDKFLILADLQSVIDAYFDGVMVMSEDSALKSNRLAMLAQMRTLFLSIADLSVLQ